MHLVSTVFNYMGSAHRFRAPFFPIPVQPHQISISLPRCLWRTKGLKFLLIPPPPHFIPVSKPPLTFKFPLFQNSIRYSKRFFHKLFMHNEVSDKVHFKNSTGSQWCNKIIENWIGWSAFLHTNAEKTASMKESGCFLAALWRLVWLGVNLGAPARTGSVCEAGLYLYLLFITAEQAVSSDCTAGGGR